MSDDGEAPIILAEDVESGAADPEEEHCHFHAGVEYVALQSPSGPTLTRLGIVSEVVTALKRRAVARVERLTETTRLASVLACFSLSSLPAPLVGQSRVLEAQH